MKLPLSVAELSLQTSSLLAQTSKDIFLQQQGMASTVGEQGNEEETDTYSDVESPTKS
jgi:hypothetical protein